MEDSTIDFSDVAVDVVKESIISRPASKVGRSSNTVGSSAEYVGVVGEKAMGTDEGSGKGDFIVLLSLPIKIPLVSYSSPSVYVAPLVSLSESASPPVSSSSSPFMKQ